MSHNDYNFIPSSIIKREIKIAAILTVHYRLIKKFKGEPYPSVFENVH